MKIFSKIVRKLTNTNVSVVELWEKDIINLDFCAIEDREELYNRFSIASEVEGLQYVVYLKQKIKDLKIDGNKFSFSGEHSLLTFKDLGIKKLGFLRSCANLKNDSTLTEFPKRYVLRCDRDSFITNPTTGELLGCPVDCKCFVSNKKKKLCNLKNKIQAPFVKACSCFTSGLNLPGVKKWMVLGVVIIFLLAIIFFILHEIPGTVPAVKSIAKNNNITLFKIG